ncbi:MAG TPA: UDP-N-acetylmuramoyl-L-alanine--D-glutamate ligase [Verrucomicrobiae bacterium]|nr:UDP-N-acetylmuramoyl-L-alanine--D-glutamate ligase [Verrucomicrobiae bacterium]
MKIALLGYGIEGKSAHRYLAVQYPQAEFTVYAAPIERPSYLPETVNYIGGRTDFLDIPADLVIRTPSIAPHRITSSGEITSVTKLFFADCPAHIIGVTGSKGKGTTASFIASILRVAGKKVHLVGNIGLGALDVLPTITADDIVVYELSSFQLWDIEASPQTAVVLTIEADHLDVHRDMNDYVQAKARIARFQTSEDRVIFYAPNTYARQIAAQSAAIKFGYPSADGFYIRDGYFYHKAQQICATTAVRLPGEHNLENALAAIIAAWPWVDEGEVIAKGLTSFHGLPHRLAFVAEKQGVKYYDDSIATTPGSSIAAIRAFAAPKVLILGGATKGADFKPLAEELQRHNIRKVLLVGAEAETIARALQNAAFTEYELIGNKTMPEIAQKADQAAQPGDVVLLSPACSSLDMFQSYQDRGDQFIEAVRALPN